MNFIPFIIIVHSHIGLVPCSVLPYPEKQGFQVFYHITEDEFEKVKGELVSKVHCFMKTQYGF